MTYASDLTDEQWELLEPVFNAPCRRGPKHAPDLRRVADAMLYGAGVGPSARGGGVSGRVGGQAAGVPAHPPRLARRSRHGRLGRARRLAKPLENTTASATGWLQVACIATILRRLSSLTHERGQVSAAA